MGLHLFITVGTTEFDELIQVLNRIEFVGVVKSLGFSEVTFQIGRSKFNPEDLLNFQDISKLQGVEINTYRYKHSLLQDMQAADMVIGHAGAGTVLDVLVNCQKPMIIVINDTLQGNHQQELANALLRMNEKSNNAYNNFAVCDVVNVIESLKQLTMKLYGNNQTNSSRSIASITEFPINQSQRFADYLDNMFE